MIHERNSPGAKFIIFPRIIKGGEEGGVVRAEQAMARVGCLPVPRAGCGMAPPSPRCSSRPRKTYFGGEK